MTADLATFPPTARRSPADQAQHLHPAALPRWRALLAARLREQRDLVTELSLACHHARQAAADPGRGPHARQQAWRRASAAARRAAAVRLALAETEAALARLAAGRFGWCQQCGSAHRHQAGPDTPGQVLPGLPALSASASPVAA